MFKPLFFYYKICAVVCACIFLLNACTFSADNHSSDITQDLSPDLKPLVILISIDGFKPEYLGRGLTPELLELANNGSIAKGLIPSFPSVTFPNHYSLVTGLYPDHHGLVNNSMKDLSIPEPFKLSSKTAVGNPNWWNEATPIWVTATRLGKKASILFWPGSEAPINGIQAQDWLVYDNGMSSQSRAKKLLEWLNRPSSSRADFATLYFSEVDSAGHQFGSNSPELNQSLKNVNEALRIFIAGIDRLGLRPLTTFVIVSDHGMTEVDSSHRIRIDQVLKEYPNLSYEWQGPTAAFNLANENQNAVMTALAKQEHMTCWPKSKIPRAYHFGSHRRIPDIVCLAKLGWTISSQNYLIHIPGQHGFDPNLQDMHGIFIASGYKIKKTTLGLFENIDVYPLLCKLLQITPEKNDANPHLIAEVLK